MSEQIVTFPAEANEKVGQYCIDHSVPLPGYFKEHKDYTEQNVANPSSSPHPRTRLDVFLTHLVLQMAWSQHSKHSYLCGSPVTARQGGFSRSDVSLVFRSFCSFVGSDWFVTGYSALAWAEGQKDLEDAEVVTLEKDPLMIAVANDAIMMAEQASHIRIVEGDPLETCVSPNHLLWTVAVIDP
jgi:hypothetical protein